MNEIKKHERRTIGEWKSKSNPSFSIALYVGGGYEAAEMSCREMCFPSGLCVTIEKVKYIFGGGSEDGVRIGLIQYPPFPETETKLIDKAVELGKKVVEANYQFSFTIVTPKHTRFYSRVEK
jgi:hypothetical protein